MIAHVFRGPGRIFAVSPDGTGANLPTLESPWSSFKSIELTRGGEPVPGLDVAECLDDIERFGYYITDAHVRITDRFQ